VSELGIVYRVLRPWLRAYTKLDQRVERVRSAFALFAEGFVLTAFDAGEQSDLTIGIYDGLSRRAEALYQWETVWFGAALPPPPARLLVGAAGLGREVSALRKLGYDVDAFEPAPRSLPALATEVAPGIALSGTYRDLICAQRGEPSPLEPLVARRYDAVLLGWGSLSHVLDTGERRALFEACAALCPRGPILASFLYMDGELAPTGRAQALGTRLGAAIAKARGAEVRSSTHTDIFLPHGGVLHAFNREELEALGSQIERTLDFATGSYPHATWRARA
jgi:hypothetical protein